MNPTWTRLAPTLTCLLLATGALFAASPGDLGRTDFPNSGSAEAQDAFLRGVLLLHSFEYEDAAEAFREARAIDPDFVMAYWGEAMTHNHPLWRQRNASAARGVLAKLAPTAEERRTKDATPREKAYLEAVEILFTEGEKIERDLAYSKAMCSLRERFPEDLDAAAFCALSILGNAQGERDFATYMRAGAIVEEVFDANPLHPGAAHYMIHSYDDPIHAPLGLRAARVYAQIAPAATHAQHMISHIYTALGHWTEASSADEKAIAVSEERAKRKGLPLHERSHHSLHWLHYSYLQQGRYRDAAAQLALMDADTAASPTRGNRRYQVYLQVGHAAATGNWTDIAFDVDTVDLGVAEIAAQHYGRGMAALSRHELEPVRAALREMKAARKKAEAELETEGATARSSATSVGSAEVMERELAAALALEEGRNQEAVALFEEAVARQEELPLTFGPPLVIEPSWEQLGRALLRLDRPAEAQEQFEIALLKAPRRAAALLGLFRAAQQAGDEETGQEAASELAGIWSAADPGIPGLEEIRKAAPPES